MKKGIAAAALVAVLVLAGCAQTVEGSIDTVVAECQEFPTDATVHVVVTGRVDGEPNLNDDRESITARLSDGLDSGTVMCTFENSSQELIDDLSGRVTIEGTLFSVYSDDFISLTDCKLR